jgi:hypothetical protein
MWEQIPITQSASDGPQHVERAVSGYQIQTTGTGQVRGRGPDAALGLNAENGIERFEYREQPRDVVIVSRMNHVDIESVHGGAVQNGGDSADDDELYTAFRECTQYRNWLTAGHCAPESPRISFMCCSRHSRRSAGVSESIQRISERSTPSSL